MYIIARTDRARTTLQPVVLLCYYVQYVTAFLWSFIFDQFYKFIVLQMSTVEC